MAKRSAHMPSQIPVGEEAVAAIRDGKLDVVGPDLAYRRLAIVNVVLCGRPDAGDRGWVLVDAGLAGSADFIADAAEERFGAGARPSAIVMTHAHFDHVGALETLAERWGAPVYAHALERPHLDGSASYPPTDPAAGGGLMAWLSPLYPRGPVDVGARLRTLPEDGSVPGMPGWRWLHTPGHTEGHVSLWREGDRALIAGDAFITTRQESAYAVALKKPELHGPPRYFTPDWAAAKASVEALAALAPELAVTGHGQALAGEEMRAGLRRLARDFDEVAVPDHGRYAPG
jgi:glyoxylase-like metal-dependent hydrolase (beta-lactamase superfamily II)